MEGEKQRENRVYQSRQTGQIWKDYISHGIAKKQRNSEIRVVGRGEAEKLRLEPICE